VRRAIVAAAMAATAPGALGLIGRGTSSVVFADQQQFPPPQPPRSAFEGPAPAPSPAERIGRDLVRVGNVLVDTAKKELSVTGFVNDVQVLEFLANTKGGWKAYESALELDTNAVNFNVGCLLIGLDPAGASVAKFQFDPTPPKGHPVEMFVEWDEAGKPRRIRAEQLIYSRGTKQTLTEGPWVYTGSVFQEGNVYLAEMEGTLVGFMHTTAPIIESPRAADGNWGDSMINPELGLKPKQQVKLIVRALPRPR
jgi:hypothetical protein